MPRKIDEAWSDDGFSDFEPVEFKDEDLDRWLEMLAPSKVPVDKGQLRLELTEIGTSLRCGHRRGARAFKIRQTTQALETLLEHPVIDCALVLDLNGRAHEALLDQLLMMDAPELQRSPSVLEALAAGQVSEASLRDAAWRAIDHLNTPPNDRFGNPGKKLSRQRDATLPWAVEELCKLWEYLKAEPVTIGARSDPRYSVTATSKSGAWITQIIISLTSASWSSRTRTAIEGYVKKRNII